MISARLISRRPLRGHWPSPYPCQANYSRHSRSSGVPDGAGRDEATVTETVLIFSRCMLNLGALSVVWGWHLILLTTVCTETILSPSEGRPSSPHKRSPNKTQPRESLLAEPCYISCRCRKGHLSKGNFLHRLFRVNPTGSVSQNSEVRWVLSRW